MWWKISVGVVSNLHQGRTFEDGVVTQGRIGIKLNNLLLQTLNCTQQESGHTTPVLLISSIA